MFMFRTRFARHIVTEFLPPVRSGKLQRVIVLCDGMPSMPRKQDLSEWLAAKGYWVFYPRYRGAWESGGTFLERSPHLDILDVIDGLNREFRELAFGRRFRVHAGRSVCDWRKLWRRGGAALLDRSSREKSGGELSGGGLGDSGDARRRRRLRIRVTRLIFAKRLEMDTGYQIETGRNCLAANFIARCFTLDEIDACEGDDVSCAGRSLCALPISREICAAHRSPVEDVSAGRTFEHRHDRAEVLGADPAIL